MIHSRRPESPESNGDDLEEPRDEWSSPFSHDHNQSVDNHSFSRTDRPIISTLFTDPFSGTESHVAVSHQRNSFVAPSINDDPFVLDEILAPPRHSDIGKGCALATFTAQHSESYELNDCQKLTKLDEVHDAAIASCPDLHGDSNEKDKVRTATIEPEEEQLYHEVLPGEITPYLGLRARLTQVPINRWTVLLLLVLARLIILFESLDTSMTDAQKEASSACTKVEDMASAMVSMPYYTSVGVNELVAMRISDTVRALIRVMNLVLQAVVDLIMFVIERTYGTIVCVATTFLKTLIEAAGGLVTGFINILDEGLEHVAGGLADILWGIEMFFIWTGIDTVGIQNAIDTLHGQTFINGTVVNESLHHFENAIPDFKQQTSDVQAVIGLPFTMVQTLLNESFGNWTMDPSDLPTAPKETLIFCTGHDAITTLFDVLFIVAKSAKVIAILGLLVTILLATAFMLWWEVQRYRKTVNKSRVFRDREPMDTVYVAGRPSTAGAGLWISEKVSMDPDRQILIRWVVAYATTYTALFVLALAVGGAFSVACQYFIMRAVQKETPAFAQEVGTFVTNSMGALERSSTLWAEESNQAVQSIESDINNHVLVYVQNATNSVITVIDTFRNETFEVLKDVFDSTQFGHDVEHIVQDLLNCVIFNALEKVENSLKWINEEAHVTFPNFSADIFSMGAMNSGNTSLAGLLTNASTQAANEVTVALDKIVISLQSGVIQEGLIALVLFFIYCLYVLFAAAQAALRTTCLRERKPLEDAEKRAHAVEKPDGTSNHMSGGLPNTPARHSLAPSYRMSNIDISQLARDLSVVMPDSPPPIERSSAAAAMVQGEAQQGVSHSVAIEDPFGDDIYAIGDEEVDDLVDALRKSGETGEDSTLRSVDSWEHDTHAIGDEEVDDIVGALRDSVDVSDHLRARKRQAWIEDVEE